mmetsp:Transcript_44433/g.110547  ORF Transcript_44433/g.110547 Transcript_44433/m.110547 type:complete len:209 (+) Transcript_44433:1660-2286(+)
MPRTRTQRLCQGAPRTTWVSTPPCLQSLPSLAQMTIWLTRSSSQGTPAPTRSSTATRASDTLRCVTSVLRCAVSAAARRATTWGQKRMRARWMSSCCWLCPLAMRHTLGTLGTLAAYTLLRLPHPYHCLNCLPGSVWTTTQPTRSSSLGTPAPMRSSTATLASDTWRCVTFVLRCVASAAAKRTMTSRAWQTCRLRPRRPSARRTRAA